jgi:hypothetical protein
MSFLFLFFIYLFFFFRFRTVKVVSSVFKKKLLQLSVEWSCIVVIANPSGRAAKAWVCRRSLAGIAGSNPAGVMDVLSIVSVVCCQVAFSASG